MSRRSLTTDELTSRLLEGDTRALARGITMVENGETGFRHLIAGVTPHLGRARVIGITGSPGVGKSTLVDVLAKSLREREQTVGIVAVDPSSPFSGGALLGDRIRMTSASGDSGVFIRSLSSRGRAGGLSAATADVVNLLDAAGFDWVIIETVGAGQSEIEVMNIASSVVVVLAPGLGDDVQAAKAGILEIGDVFVVNKADREGAYRTQRQLTVMLELGMDGKGWHPKVVKTIAQEGEGIEDLVEQLDQHGAYLLDSGELQNRNRRQAEIRLRTLLTGRFLNHIRQLDQQRGLEQQVQRLVDHQVDPYTAVDEVWQEVGLELGQS